MFHSNTYKNCETQQWFICHYNFSQIVSLKKAMGKQTFFCFNAALGTLHKLPYKHCCTTLNDFIWLTVKCSSTTFTECTAALPRQQWLCKNATMLCYMYTVKLLRVPLWLNYPSLTQVRDALTYTMTFFQKLCKVMCNSRMKLITGQNNL